MNGGFVIVQGPTHVYLAAIGVGLLGDPTSDACPHTYLECVKTRFMRDFPGKELDLWLWVCSECWSVRDFVGEEAMT